MASLVRETDNYGATHDDERVVPLATMDPNNCADSNTNPAGNPSWNTKKFLLGIMGMTAVVASGASLFLSIIDSSGRQARTAEAFLLNDHGGADDDNCLPASGPWPTGSKPYSPYITCLHSPFVTCFVSTTGGYCWSHSYYDGDTWNACTPYGFDEGAWSVHYPSKDETCGTPCTEFSKWLP